MDDNERLIDIIERTNDARPFCGCGRATEPVYRDGAVWLQCSSFREERSGRIARLRATVAAAVHVHEMIVDVPAADGVLAGAA